MFLLVIPPPRIPSLDRFHFKSSILLGVHLTCLDECIQNTKFKGRSFEPLTNNYGVLQSAVLLSFVFYTYVGGLSPGSGINCTDYVAICYSASADGEQGNLLLIPQISKTSQSTVVIYLTHPRALSVSSLYLVRNVHLLRIQ